MRTAKDIMEASFKEALGIVHTNIPSVTDNGSVIIAASNLAIAIFSYEAEMEAMRDSHQEAQEDDENSGLDFEDNKNG